MNTLQSLKKRKKGFTLTELAIVIAVIAILIAVLVPTFSSVITKARVTVAAEEATGAITAYTLETESNLADGSVVAVDGQYFFEVNGGAVDSSDYDASITNLNPYGWATNGDYISSYGDGKVTIYIDGVTSSLTTEKNYTSITNSGLYISGSGNNYYLTGAITYNDKTEIVTNQKFTEGKVYCVFAMTVYFDVKIANMTSLTVVGDETKIWVNDNSTGTNIQSATLTSIADGDYCIEFLLSGNTKKYTFTYTYTESGNTITNTITIYNNATPITSYATT